MDEATDPLKRFSRDLAPANRRSLGERVVDSLRASIVRGDFAQGSHLSEAALADAFGVSRGPIRDAFTILEREGLLALERHRGARVAELTQTDIDEIYELRRALERLAIVRAIELATAEDLAALDRVVDEMAAAVRAADVHRVVELDINFHDLVYRAARHSRLYAAWANLRPQIDFFLHSRSKDAAGYLTIAVDEHAALRDLIRAGPGAGSALAAQATIEEHLHSAYERVSQGLNTPR